MATEQSLMAVIRAARPSFRNAQDKAAFAVHAAFVAADYVLHATGPSAFADNALSSTSTDEVGIENWNAIEERYAFVYSKPEKDSKKVLMKCLVINNSLMVDVLKDGDNELLHMEIDVGEYVKDNGGTRYASQFKNLEKLVRKFNKEILGKLDGSVATSSSNQPRSSGISMRDRRNEPMTRDGDPEDPDIFPPTSRSGISMRDRRNKPVRRDGDPENPFIFRPPSGFIVPPVRGSGFSDLFPGPGAGMYPTRDDFGGGSMLLGPNDPMFLEGRVRDPGLREDLQGVPPGARFDPYGPPGVPGFEPGRFARNPGRPGGGMHPDLHHFPGGSDYM